MAPTTPQPRPLANLTLSIMCAGDSITTGCAPLENSYRKDLLDSLDTSNKITYTGPDTLDGSMTPDHQNRIDAQMGRKIIETHEALKKSLPEYQPDVILLHTGTNDVVPHENTPEGLVEQVDDLLDFVHSTSPSCTTLVALIIPAAFRGPQIDKHNGKVRAKVEERRARGEKFLCVDMVSGWPEDAFRDIAHPNGKGFEAMAGKWRTGLEEANGLGWLGVEGERGEKSQRGGKEAGKEGLEKTGMAVSEDAG